MCPLDSAFALPILNNLLKQKKEPKKQPKVLVISPTRELAIQIGKSFDTYGKFSQLKQVTIFGGVKQKNQVDLLHDGRYPILVATPGRLLDLMRQKIITLKHVQTLVLDEADRMLDMGFFDVMTEIIDQTPKKRQTLLFSATYTDTINQMCRSILNNPVTVTVESEHTANVIEQSFYQVKKHERNDTLLALFEHYQPATTVVFCHTKIQCDEVARFLHEHQIEAFAIHCDLEQR